MTPYRTPSQARLAKSPRLATYMMDPAPDLAAELTRATVEREMRSWPQPPHCSLTLADGPRWLQRAGETVARCRAALRQALLDKAALLQSAPLRERLAQGRAEPFIAEALAAPTAERLADALERTLGGKELSSPNPVELLERYLKRITVRRVRLADFRPSRRTLSPDDLEAVTAEFRQFLERALVAGEDELPVVELE